MKSRLKSLGKRHQSHGENGHLWDKSGPENGNMAEDGTILGIQHHVVISIGFPYGFLDFNRFSEEPETG